MTERESVRSPSFVRHPSSLDAPALLQWLKDHVPNSTQLLGLLTLVVSGVILLLLAGLTLTGTVMSIILLGPILLVTSPIWVPIGLVVLVTAAIVLSICGFGVGVVAAGFWLYKYFRGGHPIGSDQVDYARSRIADTATHVKDYAREYGGYLQSRVKDAAPGA